jgi:phosphatidylserine/phosphatidylglycerophosphate/cardiolipin synthase-like enzyme
VTDAFDYAEQRTGTEGFPNWFYLDQLYALNDPGTTRVHMRFFLPEYKHPELHQEFHQKSMSVDGYSASAVKVAGIAQTIVGSANWDPLTLFGAFRESQAEVFDDELAKAYDTSFWQLWGSSKVRDALPWEFTLPAPLDKVDKGLFIGAVRQLIEPLYQVEIVYDL